MSSRRLLSELLGKLLPVLGICTIAVAVLADGRFVEDIQVSRQGDEASVIIQLACPMRYQSAFATATDSLVELRVLPVEGCRPSGVSGGVASELHRPPTGSLAYLREVEFEDLGLGDGLLTLRFDRAVKYQVSQWGSLRSLELTVTLAAPETPPEEISPGTQTQTPTGVTVEAPPREPMSLRRLETQQPTRDYVLNLQSKRGELDAALLAALPRIPGTSLYVSDIELDGQVWHRLRLGFFPSEQAASEALAQLGGQFPKAWIGRAAPVEIQQAQARPIDPDAPSATLMAANDPALQAAASMPPGGGPATLAPDRLAALLADGREAMLSEEWDKAVQIYTRLLQGAWRAPCRGARVSGYCPRAQGTACPRPRGIPGVS